MSKFKSVAKKTVSLVLAVTMTVAMMGCSRNSKSNEQKSEESTQGKTSSTSGKTSTTGKTIDLTFWFANGDTVETYIMDAAERFNATVGKDKGIHVTAEYQGTYVDLHQKLQAAYISGTAPDLTVLEIAAVGMFAEGGMIESLDPFIAQDSIDMSDFHEGLLYNCIIDDMYYSVPFLRSTSILYMNKTLLKSAGIDTADLTTWEACANASKILHEKTGKYGFSIPMNYWYWEAFMLTEGGFTINADETAITVDNEVSRKILNYFSNLIEEGSAHIYSFTESDKMSADMMNQDAALWFGSTGSLTQMLSIATELGFELETAFIPKGTQYGVTTGGCNLAMLSGLSKEEQKAAWEFIKFMSTTEETVKGSIATGYLATRKSALETTEMVEWYTKYPQYKVALDQLEIASGRPNNAGYQEFQADITYGISDILCTGADVDATLAEIESKGTGRLND